MDLKDELFYKSNRFDEQITEHTLNVIAAATKGINELDIWDISINSIESISCRFQSAHCHDSDGNNDFEEISSVVNKLKENLKDSNLEIITYDPDGTRGYFNVIIKTGENYIIKLDDEVMTTSEDEPIDTAIEFEQQDFNEYEEDYDFEQEEAYQIYVRFKQSLRSEMLDTLHNLDDAITIFGMNAHSKYLEKKDGYISIGLGMHSDAVSSISSKIAKIKNISCVIE